MNENRFSLFNWSQNPFTFTIFPKLFVNHEKEFGALFNSLNGGDKFSILFGPTGSGKTTMLRSLQERFDGHRDVLYLAKPPNTPEDWVTVFRRIIQGRLSFLSRKQIDLYSLTDALNQKLKTKRLLLFVDEAHEATRESLEWLRVIVDQVANLYIVMAALPTFERTLKENLETFLKRINTKVELGSLNRSETRELIKRRIERVGGSDINPFTSEAIECVFQQTGGFPREVLRICNDVATQALDKQLTTIHIDFFKDVSEPKEPERITPETLEELPERQRKLLEVLAQKGTASPAQIVKALAAEGYKNRDNAVRSINNLLKRLMTQGFVERQKRGKTYKYQVSPKYQSMLVTA
ncbi:MAG: AAA family ATPase [Nanoarchaeota archaeon]|nr:AAA family ATPase [Nanoarchaeota archaeon]